MAETSDEHPVQSNGLSKEVQGSNQGSAFANALQTWTEIDLPTLQRKLDDQGLELKDEQKESLLSRKNLASKTKEFKKLDDKDKLEQFKGLLKLYQNEIDTLTNKKKTVENYFFGLYRVLAEAPDPRPLLEISLDSVAESAEAQSLRREINTLQEELAKKADYEQLKQRLLRTEQKSAELLSLKLQSKEDEFKSIIDEKESNWEKKEKQLEAQIKDAQKKIQELRTSQEVTELQLNNNRKPADEISISAASISAELDIVSRDAESSKKRIFELEKRNEDLRRELAVSKSDMGTQSIEEKYTKQISELEGENAIIVANLNQTRKRLEDLTKEKNNRIDTFNREIQQLSTEIKNLKARLERTDDYDEIKHELTLLRQIELGHENEESDDEKKEGEDQGESGDSKKSGHLDTILIRRNKALTQEVASYRSKFEDLTNKITELETGLKRTSEDNIKLQKLNQKLENDLADFQEVNNSGKFNDNASLISGMSRTTRGPGPGSIVGGNKSGSLGGIQEESTILPIITKQRDRFRDRNNELEDELRKQFNITNDLKRQMNSLKKDNEELYERTRYLASFKSSESNTQSIGSRSNRKLQPKSNVDLESNPYQHQYESQLHPIEQFRIREQERISSKLSPIERLFISLTRAILATRTTRMLFMVYCVGLHCTVMFITIYAMGLNTTLIPEVGLSTSTGGYASGQVGSPDSAIPDI